MSRGNKKAGARRLAKMSPDADSAWYPDLPPDGGNFEQVIPISETTSYVIRCGYDIYGRLTQWALIQRCNKNGVTWRVAVYDASHGKGLHVHIYDRENQEIDQHTLRPVSSYLDLEAALDYATERVVTDWLENELRSERGKQQEQRRAQIVPDLARITRSRDFRNSLTHVVSSGNSLTLIPVLRDDTMGYVFDRLAAGGGRGVVAMPAPHDGYVVALMFPASAARREVALEDDHIAHVHADSHVSMFFDYLDRVGTTVIQHVAAQIMERGDRELV